MVTKEQAEALVERLADKTLSFGCEVIVQDNEYDLVHAKFVSKEDSGRHTYLLQGEFYADEPHTILGHPIMLTDVLEKLIKVQYDRLKLVRLWEDCSFTKSLQDILAEAEEECAICMSTGHDVGDMHPHEVNLKGPAANLFHFLSSLFPKT